MRLALLLLLCLGASASHAVILRPGGSGPVPPALCNTGNANQIAACKTASSAGVCTTLGDYWAEIGNASGPLWTYQNGGSITRYTLVQLDSFTKFADGAYWVQKRGGVNNLTPVDVMYLHQQSGDVNMPANCAATSTVLSCAAETPGVNRIFTLGTISSGGSGYPSGTHRTNLIGSATGSGATAQLTVNGSGVVTNVALLAAGTGYLVGDVLSSSISGGSGLAVPVTSTSCYPATGQTVAGVVIASYAYGANCTGQQGVFFYNGGNFQMQGATQGSTAFQGLTRATLANEMNTTFGTPTFTASITNGSATFTNSGNNNLVTGMHVYLNGTVPTNFTSSISGGPVYYVTNANSAPTGTSFQLSAGKCNPTCKAPIAAGSTSAAVTVTVMPITYSMPLLAGGGNWSAGGMAVFLQNILKGNLLFQGALGAYEVTPNYFGNGEPAGGTDGTYCAYTVGSNNWPAQVLHGTVYGSPFAATTVTCGGGGTTLNAINFGSSPPNGPYILDGISQAQGSPISRNFKYGIANWVISDPVVNGDGSFCGIGASGVNGCIDPTTNTYYNMLVRVGSPGSGGASNQCSNLLLYAYENATQVPGPFPP